MDGLDAGAADSHSTRVFQEISRLQTSQIAPESFHPRFDARWREYRYWIAPGVVSPFLRRYAWTPRTEVNAATVRAGSRLLVGTQDLASFVGGGEGVPWSARAKRPRGTTRTVFVADCRELGVNFAWPERGSVQCSRNSGCRGRLFATNGSDHRWCFGRSWPGTAGPSWISELLAVRDRRLGSIVAPPQGLTLWRVGYDGDVIERD